MDLLYLRRTTIHKINDLLVHRHYHHHYRHRCYHHNHHHGTCVRQHSSFVLVIELITMSTDSFLQVDLELMLKRINTIVNMSFLQILVLLEA